MATSEIARRRALVLSLGLSLLIGCSDSQDSEPASNGTPGRSYLGVLAGAGNVSGTVSLTIEASSPVAGAQLLGSSISPISGTVHLRGVGDIDIVGTADGSAHSIDFTADVYTFSGHEIVGQISGTFVGPAGAGKFFAASTTSVRQPASVYCGSYAGDDSGVWDLVQYGNHVAGCYNGALMEGYLSGEWELDPRTFDPILTLTLSSGGTAHSSTTYLGFGSWNADTRNGSWTVGQDACQ